jgi:HEAT repeat protein/ankyrin repeat protein
MARILLFVLALAASPAFGQSALEKWADKLMDKQTASWKKEQIETLAGDRDPKKRIEAAKWLSNQNDPEAIAALGAALSDRDAKVRLAAANALWKDGKEAEPARAQLLKALEDTDPDVVAQAAGALQAMGMKEAELVEPRKRVLASPEASDSSRFLVARNLVGREPAPRLVEPMIVYLERNTQRYTGSVSDSNRKNVELVEQALESLVKRTRDRAIIPPLADALRNTKNGQIPLMKTLGLFEPRPEGWTQMLLAQMDAANPRVRSAALGQLRSVKGEKDVAVWAPRAAAMLQDPEASVRSDALWALGSAAGLAAASVDPVVAALGDPDKSVRRSAARALGDMGEHTQAVSAASKARVAAAARPALTAAMEKDEASDVRDEAKDALRKLGGIGPPGSLAGSGTALASVAAGPQGASRGAPAASESAGMAELRARRITFEESSFFRALSLVDVELVRAFLDAGMSPSASVLDHGPPIRVMFFAGQGCAPNQRPTKPEVLAMVKLLIERGADVNASDKNGNTALSEAASKGCDREVMRMLIKAGAKINAVNASGLTPFEMGLYSGHDGLDELIAAGYRLPPDKVKLYTEGYKTQPAAQAMIRKAARIGDRPPFSPDGVSPRK